MLPKREGARKRQRTAATIRSVHVAQRRNEQNGVVPAAPARAHDILRRAVGGIFPEEAIDERSDAVDRIVDLARRDQLLHRIADVRNYALPGQAEEMKDPPARHGIDQELHPGLAVREREIVWLERP